MMMSALLVVLAAAPAPQVRTETRPMMGTTVTVTLVGGTPEKAREGFDAAFGAFERVNQVMNEWRPDSELSAVNRKAGDGELVAIPEDLCAALRRGVQGAEQTGGLFDPTWAALRGMWRFGTDLTPALPDPAELKKRCELISYKDLEFAPAGDGGEPGCKVRLKRAGMQLGLGGLAKGWGVDEAVKKLRGLGFKNFFVQAGGDFYAGGKKAGRPWKVGIRDPRGERDSVFAVLEVSDAAFSTSGDYENFFILEGKRYHHIIDPQDVLPGDGVTLGDDPRAERGGRGGADEVRVHPRSQGGTGARGEARCLRRGGDGGQPGGGVTQAGKKAEAAEVPKPVNMVR